MMASRIGSFIAITALYLAFCAGFTFAQSAGNLSALIKSSDAEQRRTAIYLLRLDCRPDSVRPVVFLANDPLPIVRASAAPLFACLPTQEAEPLLAQLLTDESSFVRKEAAYAFSKFTDSRESLALISAFGRETDPEVKAAIVVSLGAIGGQEAVHLLVRLLQKRPNLESSFLLAAAARSIGQIAQRLSTGCFDSTIPQSFLPGKFKNLSRANSLEAVPEFEIAIRPLESIAADERKEYDVRRAAIFSLGTIGSERSLAVVRSAAVSSDPFLSEIAREALVRLGEKP
ncbi:MAG: hypothetical protein C4324_03540 [Blastocatellia bacterium]